MFDSPLLPESHPNWLIDDPNIVIVQTPGYAAVCARVGVYAHSHHEACPRLLPPARICTARICTARLRTAWLRTAWICPAARLRSCCMYSWHAFGLVSAICSPVALHPLRPSCCLPVRASISAQSHMGAICG